METGSPSTIFPHLSSTSHFIAASASGNIVNKSINDKLFPLFTSITFEPWNTVLETSGPQKILWFTLPIVSFRVQREGDLSAFADRKGWESGFSAGFRCSTCLYCTWLKS